MTTAYKLVSVASDGNLHPLFIDAATPLRIGEWMEAEAHRTKGFAYRPGWHCTTRPHAPHLKLRPKGRRRRVWVEVQIEDFETYDRPESQGGTWLLAKRMRIERML